MIAAMAPLLLNPQRQEPGSSPAAEFPPTLAPRDFHRRLPGYAPTPLHSMPEIAARLGVAGVWLKDEGQRFGLNAFKGLGASWAILLALEERRGAPFAPWSSLAELRAQLSEFAELELITATAGNHGRAVAWMARQLGLGARVFVPKGSAPARVAAIAGEGAWVLEVDGSYEDAVRCATEVAGEPLPPLGSTRLAGVFKPAPRGRTLLVQDTGWPGYEQIPHWIVEGYGTLLQEVDEALEADGLSADVCVVPIGVGSLASAVAAHYSYSQGRTRVLGAEPTRAACAAAALEAGGVITLGGTQDSVMAGLNCSTISHYAWSILAPHLAGVVHMADSVGYEAMRYCARAGIEVGESGSASLAALFEWLDCEARGELPENAREVLGLHAGAQVVLLATEGATDAVAYERILAQS